MVTAPAMKDMTWAPAAMIAVEVVQTKVSAPLMPRTEVLETPAVSLHAAVAVTAVPAVVNVLALVASTALKYMDGRATVILPPMGTAVTVVKPRVTVPVLAVPGTLSVPVVNAMSTPVVSWLPRARVAAAEANWRSIITWPAAIDIAEKSNSSISGSMRFRIDFNIFEVFGNLKNLTWF